MYFVAHFYLSCRSATSKLTMENVPWHSDVKAFSEAMSLKCNGEYEIACEHAHSCCVLLARVDKFKVNGQWFTWIDYEKFHDLVTLPRSLKISALIEFLFSTIQFNSVENAGWIWAAI